MKWPNWIVNTFTDNRPPEKRAANLPDINAKLDRIIELLEGQEKRHYGELDWQRKKDRAAALEIQRDRDLSMTELRKKVKG